MGCGGSKEGGEVVRDEGADAESRAVEEKLRQDQKEEDAIVKLLVLGTGESGKSTVFKQMKILYSVPDPPSKFVMICRANLFGNSHTVFDGMEKLEIAYETEAGKAAATLLKGQPADGNCEITDDIKDAFTAMYADPGVNVAIERAAEYQLNDSTRYFWERALEVCKSDYSPNEQDILRARVRTTGIVQQNFQIGPVKYTMFDVGGQRNERRKWIHCFDNVTAVVFVTAVSEYDQVLYEDENTNRMDEAVTLFEQICNHNSFKKTSMILFLNKRDLFEMKLAKKDLTCWKPECTTGKDYDSSMAYIQKIFIDLNKTPEERQVYAHATCATDTENIKFVMTSVFDIILKENLRKMDKVDVDKLCVANEGGRSGVKAGQAAYKNGTMILVAAWYTDNLSERKVLVSEASNGQLPGVVIADGSITQDNDDWSKLMKLGKDVFKGDCPAGEVGTFLGNFKQGTTALRELLGDGNTGLGSVYDTPINVGSPPVCIIVCAKLCADSSTTPPKCKWVDSHEDFERAHYQAYDKGNYVEADCNAPDKNAEFNPFAANPVGFRWFKGVTLFVAEVQKIPDKGVYLGILRVNSTAQGFSIMVNEHKRIMIPIIFLTCTQLTPEELNWMQGVRIRWSKKIPLLEGKKPNRGWLGPEMSGEEGAHFGEKLWWAIDEAKARLDTKTLGEFYDTEILTVDESDNIQLVLFADLAKDIKDILPGHIWVERGFLEIQNMKYLCPITLTNIAAEQSKMMTEYMAVSAESTEDLSAMERNRARKGELKTNIELSMQNQTPLKWINRVIMWAAEKFPSTADKVEGKDTMDANALIDAAIAKNTQTKHTQESRRVLIAKYGPKK